MSKDYSDINFAELDFHEVDNLPDEAFEQMTNKQAAELLQRQVDSYYRGGDFRPRKHMLGLLSWL